ncbi:MAG: glycosyltransferase family 2 protein [Nitrospirae bacterium]|nr:glycosyltransferase family 2 protein [Nitrospirota bacterium]
MKLISIVIPMYCEEKNIAVMYGNLENIREKLEDYRWEYIFVNDGSTDGSYDELKKLAATDKKVKVINFSRNFGKEIALSAGVVAASGDAVITMDADLQHPHELIPLMIEKWNHGKNVVVAIRKSIEKQPMFRRLGSWMYYKLMSKISNVESISSSTDFRLIDRKVADIFSSIQEKNRIYRGVIDWIGLERDYVEFSAVERAEGKTSFTYRKLLNLAINSITAFSLFPLKIAGYLGIIITLSSAALLFIMLITSIFYNPRYFYPITIVLVSNTFLIGIVLICLGFIALYIGNIHSEVTRRPLYIVKDQINFDE